MARTDARIGGAHGGGAPLYVPPTDVPFYSLRLRMEERHNVAEARRLMIEGAMRHEGDGRRPVLGHVSGAVNAPSVSASDRPRVRDSFDARPAADRSSVRNGMRGDQREHRRDVRTRLSDDGTCRSIIVSSRRQRERGTEAAVAAAHGGGRNWREFTPSVKRAAARRRSGGTAAPLLISTLPPSNGGNPDA